MKLTPTPQGTVQLTQRTVMLEDELREALDVLKSKGILQAEAPKNKRLARVTLIMEIPNADDAQTWIP
jgi:hypothetical protein